MTATLYRHCLRRAFSILALASFVLSLLQPVAVKAAPPDPVKPAAQPANQGAPLTGKGAPPKPGEVQGAGKTAQDAIDAALKKYVDYLGPRYASDPAEIKTNGRWARGTVRLSEKGSKNQMTVFILAQQSADGSWSAIAPDQDQEYVQALDQIPAELVTSEEKTRIIEQVKAKPVAADRAPSAQEQVLDVLNGNKLVRSESSLELFVRHNGADRALQVRALAAQFITPDEVLFIAEDYALRKVGQSGQTTLLPAHSVNPPLFMNKGRTAAAYLKPFDFEGGETPLTNGIAMLDLRSSGEKVLLKIPDLTLHLYGWRGDSLILEIPYWSPETLRPANEIILSALSTTDGTLTAFSSIPAILTGADYPVTDLDQTKIAFTARNGGTVVASLAYAEYFEVANSVEPEWSEDGLRVRRGNDKVHVDLSATPWKESPSAKSKPPVPTTRVQIPLQAASPKSIAPVRLAPVVGDATPPISVLPAMASVMLNSPVKSGTPMSAYFDLDTASGKWRDWQGHTGTDWVYGQSYDGHEGSDFDGAERDPVYASLTGTVTNVVLDCANTYQQKIASYGTNLRIDHGTLGDGKGYQTGYAHLMCDNV